MPRKIAIVMLLCLAGYQGVAQLRATERVAGKNLAKHRWSKTKLALEKGLRKDSTNAALMFIFAGYYFAPANPAFHIDSANHYLKEAQRLLEISDDKEQERFGKAGLDTVSLTTFRKKIDSAAFQRASVQNTEGAFLHFLASFPNAEQQKQAIVLRDEAAYHDALKDNTYESFLRFLEKYPKASRAVEARNTYERLLYEAKTKDRSLKSYELFLVQYPSSPYRREVEKHIFEIMTASGDPLAYTNYLSRYPYSAQNSKAKKILFHIGREAADSTLLALVSTDSIRNVRHLNDVFLIPILEKDRFGFMDQKGNMILKPFLRDLKEDYQCGNITTDVLTTSEGLISKNGTKILDDSVVHVDDLGYGFLSVETDSCTKIIHKSGFIIDNCVQEVQMVGGRFLSLRKNDKWALYAFTGKPLTLYQWDAVSAHGALVIFKNNRQHFVITATTIAHQVAANDLKFSNPFDEAKPWSSEWLWVKSANFEGVLDQRLQPVFPFDKHDLRMTFFGAMARNSSGYILYDLNGVEVASVRQTKIHSPWVAVVQDKGWQFLNIATREFAKSRYDSVTFAGPFAIGLTTDSLSVLFDAYTVHKFSKNVKVSFVPGKDSAAYLEIQLEKRRSLYDRKGRKLFTLECDQIQDAGEGHFIVTKRDKKGLVNKDGATVLLAEFDAIGSVSNQMVTLLKNMKFGAYHLRSRKLIKPQYEKNLTWYSDRHLVAFQKGSYGFIDWLNKLQGKFEFDEIQHWNDTAALVRQKSTWSIYHLAGKRIVYGSIKQLDEVMNSPDEKVFIIEQNDNFGVLSNKRGVVIPATFTLLKNVGDGEHPVYFTEKHVEEADLFVVIYYDNYGKLLYRQVYEEEDYEKILCSEN